METTVRCELAIKGGCKIFWCTHYAEHEVALLAPPNAAGQLSFCTAPNLCQNMKATTRCKLIHES